MILGDLDEDSKKLLESQTVKATDREKNHKFEAKWKLFKYNFEKNPAMYEIKVQIK